MLDIAVMNCGLEGMGCMPFQEYFFPKKKSHTVSDKIYQTASFWVVLERSKAI